MATTATPWSGEQAHKLYLQSGQFTSTIKDSEDVSSLAPSLAIGICWDGTNTPWSSDYANKLYLQSGQFTSTLKTSQDISSVDTQIINISADEYNTPWCGSEADKLYLTSGQFTSTIKDSEAVGAVSATRGISWDGTNTPWCESQYDKLYLQSGQFETTIKDSEAIGSIDNIPTGISWDGTNTPWCGAQANKLYLQSGQFTSTLKTSEDISSVDNVVVGISTNDYRGRVGPFLRSLSNTLSLGQSVVANTIRSRSIESGVVLSQSFIMGGLAYPCNFEHNLISEETFYDPDTGEFITINDGLDHYIDVQLIGIREVVTDLNLTHSVDYIHIKAAAIARSVSNTLNLSQTINISRGIENNLNLTQTVSADICHGLSNTLNLSHSVAVTKISNISVSNDLNLQSIINQTFNESDIDILCNYTPFVGETTDSNAPQAPSTIEPTLISLDEITLTCPSNASTITLRNPEIGDKDNLQYQRINRETRGGTLIVFADPTWPRIQRLILEFRGLSEIKAQELLTFIRDSLGKYIELTDWESNMWGGIITSPQNPIIREGRDCGCSVSIEFEVGQLYKESVSSDFTTLDQLVRIIIVGRLLTNTLSLAQQLARTIIVGRSLSNTLSLDQQLARTIIVSRSLSNTLSFGQIVDWDTIRPRSLSNTISLNQQLTRNIIIGRSFESTASFTQNVEDQPHTRYWVKSGAAGNWSTANNWAYTSGGTPGVGKPNSFDDVYFDGNGLADCTIDIDIEIKSLSTAIAYTGHLDNNTNDKNVTINGNTVLQNTTVSFGDATTWEINGHFGIANVNTFNRGTSKVKLTGTGYWSNGSNYLYDIEVASGADIDGYSYPRVLHDCIINGDLTITDSGKYLLIGQDGDLQINTGGSITGPGDIRINRSHTNRGLSNFQGTLTVSKLTLNRWANTGKLDNQAAFNIDLLEIMDDSVSSAEWILQSGTYDFNCDVKFYCYTTGNITITNSNNPSFNITGDIIVDETGGGSLIWTQGTGTITLDGDTNQDMDFNNLEIEDLIINKSSGTVKFVDGGDFDSFNAQAGTVDFNGQAITTDGNFIIGSSADVVGSTLNGSVITVGGNFSVSGSVGNLLDLHASATWTLAITGTAVADYVDADYSNATGTQVTATNSNDGGNNTNWNFI